jgi:hypothetical protein
MITLPNPVEMGWKSKDMGFQPILMSLSPIPACCVEIIYCSCKKHADQHKAKLRCTAL